MKKIAVFFIGIAFVLALFSAGFCKDLSSQHSEWQAQKKAFQSNCKKLNKCKMPTFKGDLGPSFDSLMKLSEAKDRKKVSKKANKVIDKIVKTVKSYQDELDKNENANKKALGEGSKEFKSLEKIYQNMRVNLIYFDGYAERKRNDFK